MGETDARNPLALLATPFNSGNIDDTPLTDIGLDGLDEIIQVRWASIQQKHRIVKI